MDSCSEELYHHGIKGMKWGVRRFQNKDGTLTAAGKKRERNANKRQAVRDIKKSRKAASKNRALMSDAELDRRIKRLEKEKRLKDLTESEVSPGKAAAKKSLDKYGNMVAAAVITAAVGAGIKYVTTSPQQRELDALQLINKLNKARELASK